MVQLVGAFQELGDGPDAPSLRDAVGGLTGVEREAVAVYLDEGLRLSAVMGFERDVLDGTMVTLTRAHLTDGEHVWRHELVYYVRKYGVALPEEFVQVAISSGRPPSEISPHIQSELIAWLRCRN